MLIYMATNKMNEKCYVGQTINTLEHRKSQHISDAKYKSNTMYFGRAIRKHGPENFTWTIIHDDVTDIEELNRLEIFYIGYYDTFENGYNLNAGGNNALLSEKTKRKLSESNKGKHNHFGVNNPFYGKRHTDKVKKQMSNNHQDFSLGNHPQAKAVIVRGIYFDTLTEAAVFVGMPLTTMYRRLKKQVPGYEYACKKEN